jgi:hypothetical protein
MNLLYTTTGDLESSESEREIESWRTQHHIVETMPMERLTSYLRFGLARALALVDAIVCAAHHDSVVGIDWGEGRPRFYNRFPIAKALRLAEDIENLPNNCAMRDGRKWKSIPFVILYNPANYEYNPFMLEETHAHLIPTVRSFIGHWMAPRRIQNIVDCYQDRVLEDYRNVGLLIRFQHGKAQVGPALRKRDPWAESDYYYAPADRRTHKGWVTVKRDSDGLRHDVEVFQHLIDTGASETIMHKFFEEHPAFLMQARLGVAISHRPTFVKPDGWTPDYTVHPMLGPELGSMIEVLELKGPAEKLLTRQQHRGFSQKVNMAVDQVRDYERCLRDSGNRKAIEKAFGYVPDNSRLAVLIGRAPTTAIDREILERRQNELNVKVITYDEILQTQADQMRRNTFPISAWPSLDF